MQKAIFWDLQGTLGGDAVANLETFEPYPFSHAALSAAKQAGYLNIIITNQSKIAKGFLSMETYRKESARILNLFNANQPLIDEMLCCPHQSSDNCTCKKPKPGLIRESAEKYHLSIKDCYVIGDMGKNEIILAHNAGCKGILVLTGGGKRSLGEFRDTWADHTADYIAENAWDAITYILSRKD